jgi:hypothetical protein
MNEKKHIPFDEDGDENSLEFARDYKSYLRFDLGDTVYLKSDLKKKCPMTVVAIFWDYPDADYRVNWMTSQKTVESATFFDKVLTT